MGIYGYENGREPGNGSASVVPSWLVAAERGKIDVWLDSGARQLAIQFKMIHNNKNFRTRLNQLRDEVINGKIGPNGKRIKAERIGVAIFVYHAISEDQLGNYRHLGGERTVPRVSRAECLEKIRQAIEHGQDPDDKRKLACKDERMLFSLDGANYTEKAKNASVWLSMWTPRTPASS